MVKSIIWLVIVIALLVFPGGRILPYTFHNNPIMGIYILVPYIWLLVLAIISLVKSIQNRKTEA